MHIGCRILISEISNLYFQRKTFEYKYDRRTRPDKRNPLSLNVLCLRQIIMIGTVRIRAVSVGLLN